MLPLPSIFQSTPNMMFGNSGPTSILSNSNPPSFLLPNNTLIAGNHPNGGIFSPHDNQYPEMPSIVDQFQMHNQPTHNTHYNQHFQPQFSPYHMMFQPQPQPQHQQQHQQHQHQHQQHQQHQQQHLQHQHQQHQQPQHNNQNQNNPSGLMPLPTPTVTKGKRRANRDEEKKDPNAPNTIPKCTRCNENASWRHDKRRWWCKECKKAFTPGISKMQNVQTIPQMATQPIPQIVPPGLAVFPGSINISPIPQLMQQPWETPNSTQSTPTTVPASATNSTASISPNCPFCKGISSWKHDKKRWFCKECRKPFTPNLLSSGPQSPSSPKKKSNTTSNKKKAISTTTTPQFMNGINLTLSPNNMLPNHIQSPLQINPTFQGSLNPPFSPISNPIMSLKPELNLSPPRSSQTLLPQNLNQQQNVNINSITNNLLNNSNNQNNNSSPLNSINNVNHLMSLSNNHQNNSIHESNLSLLISTNNHQNNSNANSITNINSLSNLSSINNISIENLNNSPTHQLLISNNSSNNASNDQNGICNSPKKSQKKKDLNSESGVQVLINVDNTVLNPIITGDSSNGVVNENNW